MDNVLCDELLQEIFIRLPPSSQPAPSSSVPLVSKRWLRLYRESRTALSLRLAPSATLIPALSSLLSNYPSVSSLSLVLSSDPSSRTFSDNLLLLLCSHCARLRTLKFLAGPVSDFSLLSLSRTCTHMTHLTVSLSRPLGFNWVVSLSSLKELSVLVSSGDCAEGEFRGNSDYGVLESVELEAELGLESLCLSGVCRDDWGVSWLWRSCKKLRKLQLKGCEGIGDGGSYASFGRCLKGLQEVELRTCRSIVDGVLVKLAENCESLSSLLLYDGGSRDSLLHFISNCRCDLRKLDLRLPLDFKNDHLFALSLNCRNMSSLRLQSCCLVTGDGLRTFGIAMNGGLQELALINCDVVEREPGLLATLGQHLGQLRKLDLSYNEMLPDKELIAMLASCSQLIGLRLRGCKGLTDPAIVSICRRCKLLESVDLVQCCGIGEKAVESLVLNSPRLRQLQVEESKFSDAARTRASHKFIEVVAA
ncbi:F-box/LRR-repeat protein 20 [Rhodamnia argentea]|uniref:F-box/LRR-repeat protein 20 n=1 Tax=Rhodamnia argentea TaxID=178133 RepID=A0A8B8P8A6_9MYRT|nr:F-box/LRR-repeat protein 20 [Rhodamnia argentea]